MSSIKVKKTTMIHPSKETPKGTLWLSKLDMIIRQPYSHTNVLHLYSKALETEVFEETLSKVLVPFYPFAGRLKFNLESKRYEVDCNAKGVLFIEAESTEVLANFGDYSSPDPKLIKGVFPTCDYSKGLESFPIILVQLTRFKCGGVCLGFATHHHVIDGSSHYYFVNSWARLARGLDLDVYPVHDRATYLAPRNPPQVSFRHAEYEPSLPPLPPKGLSGEMIMTTEECIFKLTEDQVNSLKLQVITSQAKTNYNNLSTFEVQAGHVWSTVCKARGLANDQDVKLYITANGRSRLKQMAIPQGYCGNILFHATCVEKAGDVTCKPLWYVASKIHEAIKKLDDIEYLRSAIDFVESYPDLMTIVHGPHTYTSPNFSINSWARLPCHEADFGLGKPMYTGVNGLKFEGQACVTPCSSGDGSFSITIKLFTPHMKAFKEYFYKISSKI